MQQAQKELQELMRSNRHAQLGVVICPGPWVVLLA
jgi:hypothetical protein